MNQPSLLSCREAIEQLWALIDGELDESQMPRVEQHLQVCAACFPHYDFQRAFRDFLRAHNSEPVPASLRRRIFMTLLAEEREQLPG
jgi:anti-sigma factor (TIGR02949 family)